MDLWQSATTVQRPRSPRTPHLQRQRSNSFPIVDALGCSTPEAQLLLAEGRAAVRKRRANGRRNRSVNEGGITTFDPRDHVKYLHELALIATPQERPIAQDSRGCHTRSPSDATDRSTCTVVPRSHDRDSTITTSPASPLGDYSANLAQFIKEQLKSIPAYKLCADNATPLSPRSCPELSFPLTSPSSPPPQSPPIKPARRTVEAPKVIAIPPVRPPMLSAFSAWSATDDDTDDETARLPAHQVSKENSYTPSVLGYYESSNTSSFIFSSTPLDEALVAGTAAGHALPDHSVLPAEASTRQDDDDDDGDGDDDDDDDDDESPSSSTSRPQLLSSSAPSYTSSTSNSSYFDCRRPTAITPSMRDRIVAAVTPPHPQNKPLTAMSPWETGVLHSVHADFGASQHRMHVDGMSFDMMSSFLSADRVTPC